MDELFNDVCTMYRWTHSVNETASKLGLSTGKVRKILITEGFDMGFNSSLVKKLSEEGHSASDIASIMKVSPKTVQAYLPYSKGSYLSSSRSGSAIRSERYRNKRRMLSYSDRVLDANFDYGFAEPSSRDILVFGGFFQFNLSALMRLTSGRSKVALDISLLDQWLPEDPEFFDEPPIVLEFNPTVAYVSDFVYPPASRYPGCYCLLNCHAQVLDARKRGETSFAVYMFRMEEYRPYITKYFRQFASYWNEKLQNVIKME